jgi:hypothetical protein
MTIEQAKALTYRQRVHYRTCTKMVGPRGGVKVLTETWWINGHIRLWKYNPELFTIPIKRGLSGPYGYITSENYMNYHLPSECELNQSCTHL